ncbi:hypothetical protein C6502_00685 [Candidatus Poribacteria bacterium]|nr:MAG: hypothetical protein C6502_00685 [Candidatus Poribacteria bacterium]
MKPFLGRSENMYTEDEHIIGRCLNGEPAAFGLLVDKYKSSVYALAYTKLRNFHDAEDITQEVFLKAYQKLSTLKRRDNFLAWLFSITVNSCKDLLKSRTLRPDRDYLEDQNATLWNVPSIDAYRTESAAESIREAIDELPEIYRQSLTLYYLGGLSSKEIARFLGASVDTVNQRLMRARIKLKEEMIVTMNGVEVSTIHWVRNFEEALQIAAQGDKLIMINFHTDLCYWCDQLDQKTFTDSRIIQLASEFICLKLDIERNTDAVIRTKQYNINAYPTIVFTDKVGHEIFRVNGYRPPAEFQQILLEQVLRNDNRIKELELRIDQCFDEQSNNFELAMLYLKQERIDRATPLIQEILGAGLPEGDEALLQMEYGITLARANQYAESVDCFQRVIQLSTGKELVQQAQYCLGITHGIMEDIDSCRTCFKACIDISTDNCTWSQQEAARRLNQLGAPIPSGFSGGSSAAINQLSEENRDKIAFVSNRDGCNEIYVMNADGSEQKRLTYRGSQNANFPAWSPDRTQIAFISNGQIYVINADGTDEKCLFDELPRAAVDGSVSWSPDGKWIAFGLILDRVYYKEDQSMSKIREICVINVAKEGQFFNLTKNMFHLDARKWSSAPVWSPDGSQILYNTIYADGSTIVYTTVPDEDRNLYLMNSDGSNLRQLTHGGSDGGASFSPNGKEIAFESWRSGDSEIYLMDADGENVRQLTHSQKYRVPRWSPDGKKIVLYDAKAMKIYIMYLDDGRTELLSSHNDWYPSWAS